MLGEEVCEIGARDDAQLVADLAALILMVYPHTITFKSSFEL